MIGAHLRKLGQQALAPRKLFSRQFASALQAAPKERPSTSEQAAEHPDTRLIGLNGGQIFAELMKQHNVRHLFGYPGGAILPIFDGIYQSEEFKLILPRHEQGAGHMAEGYARATGKPGVVLVTSGPGATNTVTCMQDALSDGTPMVVFTGQVPTSAIGSDAFQEADVLGISRACTKWNVMVKDIADLPRVIREAFHIATSGRPGPVLVDLPKDVTSAVLQRMPNTQSSLPFFRRAKIQIPRDSSSSDDTSFVSIARLINQAQRPILYVGQGAQDHAAMLRELAAKANIPVTTSLQGMGTFDELDPLSLHMLGMHGSAYANLAMQKADVIIAVGARFDDRVTGNLKKFAPGAKEAFREGRGGIVHLEVQPKNVNKVVQANFPLIGDCGESMRRLLPSLEYRPRSIWFEEIRMWKERYPFTYSQTVDAQGRRVGPLKPQAVLEELNKQLEGRKDSTIFTTGVGQHQMWAAQYIRWRVPRSVVTSGGLGTMGYGLPAAIGAKVGQPNHTVIDIDGDASFSMTAMEMATAAEFNIGVKVLILNNEFQGMVKQWQDLFYSKRYSGSIMKNPDWVKFAESMNCRGMRVSSYDDLPGAISQFLAHDGPIVLDALVDKEEHVYPMVPAGRGLDEMVLGPSE